LTKITINLCINVAFGTPAGYFYKTSINLYSSNQNMLFVLFKKKNLHKQHNLGMLAILLLAFKGNNLGVLLATTG